MLVFRNFGISIRRLIANGAGLSSRQRRQCSLRPRSLRGAGRRARRRAASWRVEKNDVRKEFADDRKGCERSVFS